MNHERNRQEAKVGSCHCETTMDKRHSKPSSRAGPNAPGLAPHPAPELPPVAAHYVGVAKPAPARVAPATKNEIVVPG